MRRYLNIVTVIVAAAGLAAGCDPTAGGVAGEAVGRAALTSTDVDTAPECQGILTYANTATFAQLDAFLPSNVATNIVNARAQAQFTSLASIMAVSGVAEYRLGQIADAARAANQIGTSCVGVFDQLAVSQDDEAAMVALTNSISRQELHAILPYAWNGAEALLGARPFTNVAGIANTSGIASVSLRNIRNAATLSRPFEVLAAAVNALNTDATLQRHFDWWAAMNNQGSYSLNGLTCFGIDPQYLPNGTDIRQNLATPTEVYNEVVATVNFANRYNGLQISPAAGLANLQAQLAGKEFFGCYTSYANDPWSGNNQAFFVDAVTGFGVLTETRWSE